MEEIFLSKNVTETQLFAEKFAQKIQEGAVVLLYGNLGAGKTTFVQGLAKGLGITKRIISPTFIILRSYELEKRNFYHVDLYRLKSEKEIEALGLVELMKNPDNIIVIEWPERLGSLMPKKIWKLTFTVIDENKREILINK